MRYISIAVAAAAGRHRPPARRHPLPSEDCIAKQAIHLTMLNREDRALTIKTINKPGPLHQISLTRRHPVSHDHLHANRKHIAPHPPGVQACWAFAIIGKFSGHPDHLHNASRQFAVGDPQPEWKLSLRQRTDDIEATRSIRAFPLN